MRPLASGPSCLLALDLPFLLCPSGQVLQERLEPALGSLLAGPGIDVPSEGTWHLRTRYFRGRWICVRNLASLIHCVTLGQ